MRPSLFVPCMRSNHLAALVHEPPSTAVGGRLCKVFPIPIIRYDNGPSPTSHLSSTPRTSVSSSKSGKPLLDYSIQPPSHALGPLDLLPVHVSVFPLEPTVRLHSIHLQVERRIDLHEISASPSSSSHVLDFLHRDFHSPPSPGESQELLLPPDTSTLPRVTSQSTLSSTQSPTFPLSAGQSSKSQSSLSAKRSVSTLAQMATDCGPVQEPTFSKTITMALPAAKSPSHWSNGVTLQTNLISVRFFLRTRVRYFHPLHLILLNIISSLLSRMVMVMDLRKPWIWTTGNFILFRPINLNAQ